MNRFIQKLVGEENFDQVLNVADSFQNNLARFWLKLGNAEPTGWELTPKFEGWYGWLLREEVLEKPD